MSRQETFEYDGNYPFLRTSLERSGQLNHDLRTAARDYLRVWLPLRLKPGDKLLDVGCNIGTLGHFLKYSGVLTIGIDINPDAVQAGRRLYGDERRNFSLVGDGRALPFATHSFDAVVSQDVLEHLPDKEDAEQMLNEMTRMLKPGKVKMFHKITVLEDEEHIHADQSHCIKWPTQQWIEFFETRDWNVLGKTTRHFPIMSSTSYGNFLIQRAV